MTGFFYKSQSSVGLPRSKETWWILWHCDIFQKHSARVLILIRFRTDGNIFDLKSLKSKTKVFYEYLREARYAPIW